MDGPRYRREIPFGQNDWLKGQLPLNLLNEFRTRFMLRTTLLGRYIWILHNLLHRQVRNYISIVDR